MHKSAAKTDSKRKMSEAVERISFSRPPDMPYMEIMSVENSDRRFSVFHTTYTICSNFTSGGADWIYRGRCESGHGRMLMLMEPGEIHRTLRLYTSSESFRVLYLDSDWLIRTVQQAGVDTVPHFNTAKTTIGAAYDAAASFYRCVDEQRSMLERETRLLQFLDVLFSFTAEKNLPSDPGPDQFSALIRARDFMIENYEKGILLSELAEVAGLTKFHFIRSFVRRFGMTPHAFLNHIRVAKARERLSRGAPAVGCELGFFDQSHFIKVFRRLVGVTPAVYRHA